MLHQLDFEASPSGWQVQLSGQRQQRSHAAQAWQQRPQRHRMAQLRGNGGSLNIMFSVWLATQIAGNQARQQHPDHDSVAQLQSGDAHWKTTGGGHQV